MDMAIQHVADATERVAMSNRAIAAAIEQSASNARYEYAAQIAAGIHAGNENCTAQAAGKKAVLTLEAIEKALRR